MIPNAEPFQTTRLHLEPLKESHFEGYHKIWSSEPTAKWSPQGPSKTREESLARLKDDIVIPTEDNPIMHFGVFLLPHEQEINPDCVHMIARLVVFKISDGGQLGELGYMFHPSAWGRGYATEAINAFVKKFWELRPHVKKIEGVVERINIPSQRVLIKCGFLEVKEHDVGGIVLPAIGPEKLDPPLVFILERPRD